MTEKSVFSIKIIPRSYELDAFGHVNNAVFLHYFEHARVMWLREAGIQWADFEKLGLFPVVVNVNINYYKPIDTQDPITVTAEMTEKSERKIVIHQTIIAKDGTLHAEGDVTAVFVDKNNKTVPLPDPIMNKLKPKISPKEPPGQ